MCAICLSISHVPSPSWHTSRLSTHTQPKQISLAEDAVLERLNSVLEPGRSLTLAEKGGGDDDDGKEEEGEGPDGCVLCVRVCLSVFMIPDCYLCPPLRSIPYHHSHTHTLHPLYLSPPTIHTHTYTTPSPSSTSTNATGLLLAAPQFRLLATMNPGGDYGKRELSPALRSRFTEIWVPPLRAREDVEAVVVGALAMGARVSRPPVMALAGAWVLACMDEGWVCASSGGMV
jgi:hypothetical protein